ncbi:cytochrome P450 [Guyanagaster necrorhizus]|uniref:Cytochrome P450 n=1 Tax=Guyanagaster necrorhizus TaxID=856835 RepID=A0A9P8AP02_9AGAR|nr:cytochrome P450 [Guyanagaster necrorhizus MCA 3950]KAG7442296.1 cytochrome P450 [Guyanagaster necrorhizus MCA 3950]
MMPISLSAVLTTLAAYILARLAYKTFVAKGRRPPGPRGLPFIGNALDMPTGKPWLTFARWGATYGAVCSATALGQTFVILNSYETAVDLLDRRGSVYSERPHFTMGGDMVGWKSTLGLLPNGHVLRRQRKLLHGVFGANVVGRFHKAQETVALRLARNLIDTPDKFSDHISRRIVSFILNITYGYEVGEDGDALVELVDRTMAEFSQVTVPGAFLVDQIPFLRFLPEWLPGMAFKSKARQWATDLDDMVNVPYRFTEREVATGIENKSFVSTLIHQNTVSEHDLKWAASAIYGAAGETTIATIHVFLITMVLFPGAQKAAHAEIDDVLQGRRLPTCEDRDKLPYVNALCKEVMRFHPAVPLSVPHSTLRDDIYNDYLIPKDSVILANLRNMAHDPTVYKDPDVFNPSRFLPGSGHAPERDPRSFIFGFGRRKCPGQYLADEIIFIICAMVLSVFDISKADNFAQEPVLEPLDGTISRPAPFQCSISPRSPEVVDLVKTM